MFGHKTQRNMMRCKVFFTVYLLHSIYVYFYSKIQMNFNRLLNGLIKIAQVKQRKVLGLS